MVSFFFNEPKRPYLALFIFSEKKRLQVQLSGGYSDAAKHCVGFVHRMSEKSKSRSRIDPNLFDAGSAEIRRGRCKSAMGKRRRNLIACLFCSQVTDPNPKSHSDVWIGPSSS